MRTHPQRLNSLEAFRSVYPMSLEDMADSYRIAMSNYRLGDSYYAQAERENDFDHMSYVLDTMTIEYELAKAMSGKPYHRPLL